MKARSFVLVRWRWVGWDSINGIEAADGFFNLKLAVLQAVFEATAFGICKPLRSRTILDLNDLIGLFGDLMGYVFLEFVCGFLIGNCFVNCLLAGK